MNAVSSDSKTQDPNERASEATRWDDNERLRRTNPFEVSRTTCSTEAADYAYRHFPSPMTTEWRAASAGYDEGVAKGAVEGLNKASEMGHYIDRLEGDMITQDLRIKELEAAVREAQAVVEQAWASAPDVTQKAQARFAEVPTAPQDFAEWPTLATGPIEPDTKQRDPESDVAWLKEQLLLLQTSIRKMRTEFDERERAINEEAYRINEEAYRRGWQDAFQRNTPVTPATPATGWPATPFWFPQVIA